MIMIFDFCILNRLQNPYIALLFFSLKFFDNLLTHPSEVTASFNLSGMATLLKF